MTRLEFTRSDEKATAILKAVRLIDEGVELAPVVPCKDCVRYNTKDCADGFGWCEAWDQGRMDNDFCSHGAKLGGGGKNAAD